MRNSFLIIILGVWLLLSGLAFAQNTSSSRMPVSLIPESSSRIDILEKELASLNLDNPEADVIKNITIGDKRFIGFLCLTQYCPGISTEECLGARQMNNLRVLSCSDRGMTIYEEKLQEQAKDYALRYNKALKKKLSSE
jgi:hypothetical protein